MDEVSAKPSRCLSVVDAVAITVGIVIGSMIFKAPSWVAASSPGVGYFIGFWVAGGIVSLIGALCYAELAATYPDCGGDYHFISRAFGGHVGFLFAWARLAVIQTGSIAIQAFVIGDYATKLFDFGPASPGVYAAAVVILLTLLNVLGLRQGKWTQIVLTGAEVIGVLLLIAVGFWLAGSRGAAPAQPSAAEGGLSFAAAGMAMVFVLLTYGGWNEAAYLSAEVRGRRGIAAALFWSIGVITAIYVLANLALVAGLGLDGVAGSEAVAADLFGVAFGPGGAAMMSVIVVLAALSTMNATIFTGARTNYALGRDFPLLARLGQWEPRGNTPANALIVQGVIALTLVVFGGLAPSGFKAMVEFTTPVFWFFFLLAACSLFVLRWREPGAERPFRVPLYPITPILFVLVCGYMLYSSIMYHGLWALVGVAVLAAGVPVMLLAGPGRRPVAEPGRLEPVLGKG